MTGPRARLVVLFGGRSAEHDVSCVTAADVLRVLDPARYDVVPVGITRQGRWVAAEGAAKALAAGPDAVPAALVSEGPTVTPDALVAAEAGGPPVVVLPLLHGPLGEDGTVQGLLELADVAYVGTGVLGSALAMDKAKAKEVLAFAGVPQCRWISASRRELQPTADAFVARVVDELGLPVFVKPANLGSSVGISRATDVASLHAALALAGSYDDWIVVEEAVTAREIELAVLGDGDDLAVSVPGEVVPSHDFYDYEDKYLAGAAQLIVPAEVSDDQHAALRELALRACRALRVEGLARVDFLVEEGGRGPLLNEVNTMPGFTPISMYPRLWAASGVGYAQLVDRLVELALARHAGRRRRTDHA